MHDSPRHAVATFDLHLYLCSPFPFCFDGNANLNAAEVGPCLFCPWRTARHIASSDWEDARLVEMCELCENQRDPSPVPSTYWFRSANVNWTFIPRINSSYSSIPSASSGSALISGESSFLVGPEPGTGVPV